LFFFREGAFSESVGGGGVRGLLPSNAAPKRRAFPFPSFGAFLRSLAESRLEGSDASSSASRTARSSAERSASAGG